MLYRILVIIAFASLSLKANAQMKVIVNGIEKYTIDTMPKAMLSPIKSFSPEQLSAFLQQESRLALAPATVDKMPCLKPDMTRFSAFPAVDPTKKAGYVADNMPNAFPGRISISGKPDAKK